MSVLFTEHFLRNHFDDHYHEGTQAYDILKHVLSPVSCLLQDFLNPDILTACMFVLSSNTVHRFARLVQLA